MNYRIRHYLSMKNQTGTMTELPGHRVTGQIAWIKTSSKTLTRMHLYRINLEVQN